MIEIQLKPPSLDDTVVFAHSPLVECVLSLHVLVRPREHALRHSWARRMSHLSGRLLRRINAFSFAYRGQVPSLLVPEARAVFGDFHAEAARLSSHSPELTRDGFAGRLLSGSDRDRDLAALVAESADERLARAPAELLLDDPVEFAREFGRLLEDYWQAAFRDEWLRVEPYLRSSTIEDREQALRSGTRQFLARLSDKCRFDPVSDVLGIRSSCDRTVSVTTEDPLVLLPSTFVWPHIFVNTDPHWPTWLAYAPRSVVRAANPPAPPSELVDGLHALADENRLRVLKLIAAGPRSTQELAPLVGLSTSGVSKCLKTLLESGLVTKHREGRYVVYKLADRRLTELSKTIDMFLATHRRSADAAA